MQGSGKGKSKMTNSGTKRACEWNHNQPSASSYSSSPKKDLLKLQADHRSEHVLKGKFLKPLFMRAWDPRYKEYVIQAGLYGVHKIGHIPIDRALISALVERWRQETHSFHFPVGEMTITLEDASVLLGLRANGDPLCLPTNCDWADIVETLLGKKVDKTTFRRRSKVAINISWLCKHFAECPKNASIDTVKQYARAYLFLLVGTLLFPDRSGDSISAIYLPLFRNFERAGRYSWASAVLEFLYRELCLASNADHKQICGSVLLLQLWSQERLPIGCPGSCKNLKKPPGDDDVNQLYSGHHRCLVDQTPGGVLNTYSSANNIRQIATSIVEKFKDVADEEMRVFARDVLLNCKAAINDLLEPIDGDEIFAAFDDNVIPQQQNVEPVNGDDPGPSSRPEDQVNLQG